MFYVYVVVLIIVPELCTETQDGELHMVYLYSGTSL